MGVRQEKQRQSLGFFFDLGSCTDDDTFDLGITGKKHSGGWVESRSASGRTYEVCFRHVNVALAVSIQ